MSISILPPEILGEIFVRAQPNPLYIPFHHRDPHIVLSQVCRHWQAVVSSTPFLWAHMSIQFTNPFRLKRFIQIAEWCLSRSSNFPATLHALIHSPTSSHMTLASMSNEVVRNFIRPNAHRWQKLNLIIAPESFDLLLTPIGSFLNLKDLTVQISAKRSEFTLCDTISTCLALWPLLTHLKLSTLHSKPVNVWNLQCPWSRMTLIDLSASKITVECCHAILRECRQLKTFLVFTLSYHKPPDDLHPIILPHLNSLSVTLSSIKKDFSAFFAPFVIPNLKHFRFHCFDRGTTLHAIGFQAFQHRSNFQLEHLELRTEVHNGPAFHDILTSCPSLLKLGVSDESFLRNNVGFAMGAIVPKLEHIILTSGKARSSELLAIVDARTRPGYPTPLKRLEASAVSLAELHEAFGEFITRGLQVG